jgi:uncharacterized protein (DUF983 family)
MTIAFSMVRESAASVPYVAIFRIARKCQQDSDGDGGSYRRKIFRCPAGARVGPLCRRQSTAQAVRMQPMRWQTVAVMATSRGRIALDRGDGHDQVSDRVVRTNATPDVEGNPTVPDTTPVVWPPDRTPRLPPWPVPPLGRAMLRGCRGLCPACGQSRLFAGYLSVVPVCPNCGAPLGLARADDAPPYFTILLVGHVVVPGVLILERICAPPVWVQMAIWLPVTLALSLLALRPIKGAIVGLMLNQGMLKPVGDA